MSYQLPIKFTTLLFTILAFSFGIHISLLHYMELPLFANKIVLSYIVKFIVFFILFYPLYKSDGDIQKIEFATFFVPYSIALILETYYTSKMLNNSGLGSK